MKRFTVFMVMGLWLSLGSMAQTDSTITHPKLTSTTKPKRKPARKLDLDPLINLDNYTSLFYTQPVTMWGAKLGIDFMKTYRMGFGGYWMFNPVVIPTLKDTTSFNPISIDSTKRRFHLYYINTFMEFVLLYNYRWELSLPFSVGYGVAKVEHYNERAQKWVNVDNRGELVSTIGLQFHYRVFSWVGVGFGLGYRNFWIRDPEVQQALNGVYWSLKFKIFLGYMYKAVFNRQWIRDLRWEYKEMKRERKMLRRIKLPRKPRR